MITIIEIPHQRPPRAWVAKDYKTACDVCSSIATDNEVDGNDRAALYEWLARQSNDGCSGNRRRLARFFHSRGTCSPAPQGPQRSP
jgi:hypothetical protein